MPTTSTWPPGPALAPYRQLQNFLARPFEFFTECAAKHGHIFTVRLLGQPPWVYVSDPELVKQLFAAPTEAMDNNADATAFLMGPRSILFLTGEEHRQERKKLAPVFHRERMAIYAQLMLDTAGEIFDGWQP